MPITPGKICKIRCDECAPEFGCWNFTQKCRKYPDPTAPRVEASDATPRTDAVAKLKWQDAATRKWMIEADFARQLEREVIALTTELAAAKLNRRDDAEDAQRVITENDKWRRDEIDQLKAKEAATSSRLAEVEAALKAALAHHKMRCDIAEKMGVQTPAKESWVSNAKTLLSTTAPAPADRARVEELEALVAKLRDYLDYLREAELMTFGILHAHGWKYPSAFLDRGVKLRAEIAALDDAARPARGDAGKEEKE